jgi:hypothetical protein
MRILRALPVYDGKGVVKKVKEMREESEISTEFASPAGTSKYVYDGSGNRMRDPNNRSVSLTARSTTPT